MRIRHVIWLLVAGCIAIGGCDRSARPPEKNGNGTGPDTPGPKQSHEEKVTAIAAALGRIQVEGGQENNLLIIADEDRNYYIQFLAAKGSTELSGEAVSNGFLEPENRIPPEKVARLKLLGWQPPRGDGNLTQEWQARNDDDRRKVAEAVLEAFADCYMIPRDAAIKVEVDLR